MTHILRAAAAGAACLACLLPTAPAHALAAVAPMHAPTSSTPPPNAAASLDAGTAPASAGPITISGTLKSLPFGYGIYSSGTYQTTASTVFSGDDVGFADQPAPPGSQVTMIVAKGTTFHANTTGLEATQASLTDHGGVYTDNVQGMYLENGTGALIDGATLKDNKVGIYVHDADVAIRNATFSGNTVDLYVMGGQVTVYGSFGADNGRTITRGGGTASGTFAGGAHQKFKYFVFSGKLIFAAASAAPTTPPAVVQPNLNLPDINQYAPGTQAGASDLSVGQPAQADGDVGSATDQTGTTAR